MCYNVTAILPQCTICSKRGSGFCESLPFVLDPKVLPVNIFGSIPE